MHPCCCKCLVIFDWMADTRNWVLDIFYSYRNSRALLWDAIIWKLILSGFADKPGFLRQDQSSVQFRVNCSPLLKQDLCIPSRVPWVTLPNLTDESRHYSQLCTDTRHCSKSFRWFFPYSWAVTSHACSVQNIAEDLMLGVRQDFTNSWGSCSVQFSPALPPLVAFVPLDPQLCLSWDAFQLPHLFPLLLL